MAQQTAKSMYQQQLDNQMPSAVVLYNCYSANCIAAIVSDAQRHASAATASSSRDSALQPVAPSRTNAANVDVTIPEHVHNFEAS